MLPLHFASTRPSRVRGGATEVKPPGRRKLAAAGGPAALLLANGVRSRTDLFRPAGRLLVLFVAVWAIALCMILGTMRGDDPPPADLAGLRLLGGEVLQKRAAAQAAPVPGVVPPSMWPVSVAGEEFEDIIHPGNPDIFLSVPRFWSRPIPPDGDRGIMSRDLALSVGTCSRPDAAGGYVRGKACPPNQRTIFVALASYRDYQCRETLDDLLSKARFPERIRIAVVDQRGGDQSDMVQGSAGCTVPLWPCSTDRDQALCRFRHQIELHADIPRRLAVGPAFARHIAYRYYRGEYYVLQVDAQTTFVQDWDVEAIQQHEATGDEMAVLSHTPMDVTGSIDVMTGRPISLHRNVMCQTHFVKDHYLVNDFWPIDVDAAPDAAPMLQPFWSAAFSFARGHFAVNVPYDMYLPMLFEEEEISVGLRGFTAGYDYFAPSNNICFHTYAQWENEEKRNMVPLFWENEGRFQLDRFDGDPAYFRRRVLGMLGLDPKRRIASWNHVGIDLYGLGHVRSNVKFFDLFGIYPRHKKHEHNLCLFVEDGKMHETFIKHLQKDGMGIDYTKIDYQFRDPFVRKENDKSAKSEHSSDDNDFEYSDSGEDEDEEHASSPKEDEDNRSSPKEDEGNEGSPKEDKGNANNQSTSGGVLEVRDDTPKEEGKEVDNGDGKTEPRSG